MTNEAASKLTEHNRGMTEIAHSAEGVVSISELNSTSALELTETVKQITSTMDELRNMADVVDEALSHYSV
jgi:methyl-accepting chemotaxis protein